MNKPSIAIFWFRRDLRLSDNTGLSYALKGKYPVLPLFIFDNDITDSLPKDDHRIGFIYDQLEKLNQQLTAHQSGLLCLQGNILTVWEQLTQQFDIKHVFTNQDSEPYAIKRDANVKQLLDKRSIGFHLFKDQVIFDKDEVLKKDHTPYTVFTPYKNKWLSQWHQNPTLSIDSSASHYVTLKDHIFPTLSNFGFKLSNIKARPFQLSQLANYEHDRNIPSRDTGSYLGPHLRFGTVGIRELLANVIANVTPNKIFISELVWREFFMQILAHYPQVVNHNFKAKYNSIQWRNDETEFAQWCAGETGYPMVDAGMRELNQSGYMHNRVRMVTASFLCKHLLIDWRWGEAYFAQKLFDYELSSNNGNWQWSAGTGCDAAPYFRVFNPIEQLKKFDPDLAYVQRWLPEFNTLSYPQPMVEHKFARERALSTYKTGLNQ